MGIFIDGPLTRINSQELHCFAATLGHCAGQLEAAGIIAGKLLLAQLDLCMTMAPNTSGPTRESVSRAIFDNHNCLMEVARNAKVNSEKLQEAADIYASVEPTVNAQMPPFFYEEAAKVLFASDTDDKLGRLGVTVMGNLSLLVGYLGFLNETPSNKGEATKQISASLAGAIVRNNGPYQLELSFIDENGKVSRRSALPPTVPSFAGSALAKILSNKYSITAKMINSALAHAKSLGTSTANMSPQVPLKEVYVTPSDNYRNPSSQVAGIEKIASSGKSGQFQIQKHVYQDAAGHTKQSWSVLLRGTQNWGTGGSNPQDMQTNLQLVGGLPTDQSVLVEQALEAVGVRPGDAIELVGHSQAGGEVANLCADAEFTRKYHVVSALTLGGPTGIEAPSSQVSMLQVESLDDFVPSLDGASAVQADNVITVRAGSDLREDGHIPHALASYENAVEQIETSENTDLKGWLENRTTKLGLDHTGQTYTYTFNTRRY